MTYRVVFTDAAQQDLLEIADYIADNHSVEQALYVIAQIRKRVETLKVPPHRGGYLPELIELGAHGTNGAIDYRQLHWKPYRIIYVVIAKVVNIVVVSDGRRDLASLLLRRLVQA